MPPSGQKVVLVMVLAIGGIDTKGELPNLLTTNRAQFKRQSIAKQKMYGGKQVLFQRALSQLLCNIFGILEDVLSDGEGLLPLEF